MSSEKPEQADSVAVEIGEQSENLGEEHEMEDISINQETLPKTGGAGDLTSVMQNPQVLAALQDRLDGLVGKTSGYIDSLPKEVKRRVYALKNLQVKHGLIEAKFYEEVHELEVKYAAQYAGLYAKRRDIVTGALEPTDSDCEWESEGEEDLEEEGGPREAQLASELREKASLMENEEGKAGKEGEEGGPAVGIPDFWLTMLKNVDILADMIQEGDEPILQALTDIGIKFSSPGEPMSFTLEFHFEPNEYFNNSVLTKTYSLRVEPDNEDPFSFEGPEIIRCAGCTIDWQKGKNVTIKLVKKRQKHKGRGTTRTVTKQVQADSFFNFFSPPPLPQDPAAELDEETEALLAADYEIGHFFRERIIPRAVLYFTGEANEEEEYEEEGDEEGEEDEEGDEDEDNDPDYDPSKADQTKPAECKQQ